MSFVFDADIVGPWVCERAGGTWVSGRGTAIGRVKGNRLVGGVLFEDFNGANIFQHIALEEGFSKEFLGFIFQYPFFQLKVKRTTAPIASTNHRCIKLVEKLGFEREAILKSAVPSGDLYVYVMWKENCRFLDDKYGKFFVQYR